MDKKVYVLVPVYNVEKVLNDCLNSVINQTYRNWEMIIVDDGTPDNSGKICDEYAEKDNRIRVIHQKNTGLFGARITGVNAIDETEDTYCFFLDSDDILSHNALKILIDTAEKYNSDIVSGVFTKFLSFKKPDLDEFSDEVINCQMYRDNEVISKLYTCCFGYGVFPVSLVSKLYKTDLIKKAFAEIKTWPKYFGEDLNASLRILPMAKSVATIDNIVYYYRYGGGTNKFMKSYIDDCLLLYKSKKEYWQKNNMDEYYNILIDVEMKNLAMQYLVMCIRSRTYPHGKIEDEIKYILEIPEFYNAVCSITDETLKRDYSEAPGFTQAFVKKDVAEIRKIVKAKANEKRLLRFIKNML